MIQQYLAQQVTLPVFATHMCVLPTSATTAVVPMRAIWLPASDSSWSMLRKDL